MRNRPTSYALPIIILFAFAGVYGQSETSPSSKEQTDANLKLESNAESLLNEVVAEAPALKLPDNQVRIQIIAGDLLWRREPVRARSLFTMAGVIVARLASTTAADRGDDLEIAKGLRRELVLTAARHDVDLAFELFRATRIPANDKKFDREADAGLEQSLLAIVARTDPTLAYRKMVESLEAGEYPEGIPAVLRQLYKKDREAFEKLTTKLLASLTEDNLITNETAGNLAVRLLEMGPIPESEKAAAATQNACLTESQYRDLLEVTTAAALTALPGNERQSANLIGLKFAGLVVARDVYIVSDDGPSKFLFAPRLVAQPVDEAQNNAQRLLSRLQTLLPRIDQYLPSRASAVRQKLTDFGIQDEQSSIDLEKSTSESLLAAAKSAPTEIQPEIYEQAAQKAIAEGNTERALQIANDHLSATQREATLQAIETKKMATNPSSEQLEKIRQRVANLTSNSMKVTALIDLAAAMQKANPKLALSFLNDAVIIVSKKARNYQDFNDQLKVVEALAALDPKRSFALIEIGIAQLNDILAAAAVVNGFEAEVFREDELPLQGGSELGNMVRRYGWELGSLAKRDFESARSAAEKFQLPESRLLVKLLIAQRLLRGKTSDSDESLGN